jgi:TRAP-type C4-dicarboxylate transport system permease small subunit
MKKVLSLMLLFSLNIHSNPTSQWYQDDGWSGPGIWPLLAIPVFGFLAILIFGLIKQFFQKPKDIEWEPIIIFLVLFGPAIAVGFIVL